MRAKTLTLKKLCKFYFLFFFSVGSQCTLNCSLIQYVPGTENQKIKLVNTLNLLIKSLFSFSNQQTCKGYSILCFGSVYWILLGALLYLLLQETNVKYKNTISYSSFQNSFFCLLIIFSQ